MDWNEKVGNQTLKKEVPRVTGKFGLGVQNETEQRLTDFCQENTLVIKKTLFEQHKRTLLLLLSHFSRVRLCATPQSPPGSAVPGILQARTLGWVAISFSNAWKWKEKLKSLSHVWLFATPWTAAYQTPLSMGFSRQEYWSGVPFPSPREDSTHGQHQMVNTEIRLIIFFAAKDGEALYSQQK